MLIKYCNALFKCQYRKVLLIDIYRFGFSLMWIDKLNDFYSNQQVKKAVMEAAVPMLESLFNKVAGLKACNFIKNGLQHRYFPVNVL